MSEATKSIFQTLYDADVTGKVKKKNGLSYISWAAAWAEVKKRYPDATYHVYTCQPDPYEETITEYKDGVPVMSRTVKRTPQPRPWFDDGKSAWVEVSVTINGQEAKETYAIMDFKNNAVKADRVTSTDANKAKMRALARLVHSTASDYLSTRARICRKASRRNAPVWPTLVRRSFPPRRQPLRRALTAPRFTR